MKKIISSIEKRFLGYRVIGMVPRIGHVEFHLKATKKMHSCPICKKKNFSSKEHIKTLHDIPQNGFPVVLKFEIANCKCEGCGEYIVHIEEEDGMGRSITVSDENSFALKAWIKKKDNMEKLACGEIASACGLHIDTVHSLLKKGVDLDTPPHK